MNGFTDEQYEKLNELRNSLSDLRNGMESILDQDEKRDIELYYSRTMRNILPKRTVMINWCLVQVDMAIGCLLAAIREINSDALRISDN